MQKEVENCKHPVFSTCQILVLTQRHVAFRGAGDRTLKVYLKKSWKSSLSNACRVKLVSYAHDIAFEG